MSFESNYSSLRKLTPIAVVVSASDIELSDRQHVNTQIGEMQSVLASLGFDAQTVFHCRSNNVLMDNGTTGRTDHQILTEHGRVCSSLNEAIEISLKKTKCVSLAVTDLAAVTSNLDWQWILDSIIKSDVACCFNTRPSAGKRFTRVASFVKDQLSRLLMRTGKTDSRPGIVAFNPSVIQDLINSGVQAAAAEELVACCRADGRTIAEAELNSSDVVDANNVTLKPILASAGARLKFWWNTIAFPQHSEAAPSRLSVWTSTQWLIAFSILLMASLMFFTNLGYPLLEPDEARNAQLGLNVYQTGEWMSLMIDGDYYWDKPPLQAWMTAASYHMFGPNEFAARLPCATLSLTCVLAVLFLGDRLFGYRTGCVAAIALILSGGFTVVARYITMDASLCCFATIMFLAILLATRFHENTLRKRWLVLAGIACGLGLLVKGPVIGVVVMPPVLITAWLQQKSFYTNPRFWTYLFAPAILIAAPWFLAMAIVHPEFIKYFFWKHHVVRFADAFNHQQPWWFYLPVIIMMTYPAVFLMPQLIRLLRISDRESRKEFGACFGPMLVYVLWVVGFFSLSEAKLPTYILPSVPILCLLMGRTVDLGLGQRPVFAPIHNKLSTLPRQVTTSVSIMLTISIAVAAATLSIEDPSFFAIAGIAITTCVVLLLATLRKKSSLMTSFAPAIVAGTIFLLVCNGLLLPLVSGERSSQHAIKRLFGNPEFRDATVVYVGRPPRGTFFSVPEVDIKHFNNKCRLKAVRFLASHPNSIVIASKDNIETLQREMDYSVRFDPQEEHRKIFICRSVFHQSSNNDYDRISKIPRSDVSSTAKR